MSRLRQFLAPKAIAIAGCPGDLSRPGARPLVYLLRHGFAGAIYPVNPRHEEIGGLPASGPSAAATAAAAGRGGAAAHRTAVVRAARELLPLLKGRGAEGLLVQKMVRG